LILRRTRLAALLLTLLVPAGRIAIAAAPAPAPLNPSTTARLQRAGGVLPTDHAVAVTLEGIFEFEGHLARPHQTTRYHSSRRITVAGPDRARSDWTTWRTGDTTRSVESTLLLGARVLHRDDAGSPWIELAGRAAAEAAWPIWTAAPALMAARALAMPGIGGGPISSSRSLYSWIDPYGSMTLYLDALDQPDVLQAAYTDPRRGSVTPGCRYLGFTGDGGLLWPDSLETLAYPEGNWSRLTEGRKAIDDHADVSVLALPASVQPAEVASTDTVPVTSVLAPHVWAIELRDTHTRSLLLEFKDHLVLLETGSDVPHGERLRAACAKLGGGKPVRYVSFGHHHPDYTGGLRAFLADSATVVCVQSNREYVNEIGHAYFGLDPDRLAKRYPGGMTPAFDTLTAGRWRHADAMNEVVAIDIGGKSNHTDAYVVFWLPRAKLLFEGDLGWFDRAGVTGASSRAAGLLQALDDAKVAPVTLLQGWTPGATAASMPAARLRELVAARAAK
jgi:glyoxylase-like metal-dependent hydrolase (beta-lactamase superfamily II)